MKKILLVIFFFCSFVVFADSFRLIDMIEQKEAQIYTDGDTEEENLLVFISTTNGWYVAYYEVQATFKNTFEVGYYDATIVERYPLTIGDILTIGEVPVWTRLRVFDVDEKEGTITVRYEDWNQRNDWKNFKQRTGKFVTFKRTNKFNGKNFIIYRNA
jgi:hypothetical protein